MRINKFFPFLIGLALLAPTAAVSLDDQSYYVGGERPFLPESRVILDRYADILSLGINSTWMDSSNIAERPYIQAIERTAIAVRNGDIPGAVFLADRTDNPNVLAVAVGKLMTDPQEWDLERESRYYVHDLGGVFVTSTLTHLSIIEKKLSLDQKVGDLLPVLAASDKAPITIEMLLRHSSGLPDHWDNSAQIESREEMFRWIAELKLDAEPGARVIKSPMNFALLGLVVEKVQGKSLNDLLRETIPRFIEMPLTALDIPDQQRFEVPPGAYDENLGRMVWAEPDDPLGIFLEPNAGHTGLVCSAEDLRNLSIMTQKLYSLEKFTSKYLPPGPIGMAMKPAPNLPGGEHMGLGIEVGKYGKESFGWDSPRGCSFWILPEKSAAIIFMSNPDHPNGIPADWNDPRPEVLSLLYESLPITSEDASK